MGTILNRSKKTERVLVCQEAIEIQPNESIAVPALLLTELHRIQNRNLLVSGSFDIVKGMGNVYVKKYTLEIQTPEDYVVEVEEGQIEQSKVEAVSEEPEKVDNDSDNVNETEVLLAMENPAAELESRYGKPELLEMVGVFTKVDYKIKKLNKLALAGLIVDWLREQQENHD